MVVINKVRDNRSTKNKEGIYINPNITQHKSVNVEYQYGDKISIQTYPIQLTREEFLAFNIELIDKLIIMVKSILTKVPKNYAKILKLYTEGENAPGFDYD